MRFMRLTGITLLGGVLALAAVQGLAQKPAFAADDAGYRTYSKAGTFANVRDDLKDAIIARGYVIDHVGAFAAMLERTAEAAGGGASPYKGAEYLQFCPVGLTHEGVKASPFYIVNCPIVLFVLELKSEPGKVHVGYRLPIASSNPAVQAGNAKLVETLDAIAKDVTK